MTDSILGKMLGEFQQAQRAINYFKVRCGRLYGSSVLPPEITLLKDVGVYKDLGRL